MDISEKIKKATEDISKIQIEVTKRINSGDYSEKSVQINSNRLQKVNKLLDEKEERNGDISEQIFDVLTSILE